jgi:hypothetical protein
MRVPAKQKRRGGISIRGAWLALHPPTSGHAIFQAAVNGRTDTPVFTDIGPRGKGFPLLVRKTERSTLRDAEGNIRTHMSEVVCRFQIHVFSGNSFYLVINLCLKFSQPIRTRRVNGRTGSPGNRATRRKSRGGTNTSGSKASSENSVTSSRLAKQTQSARRCY